MKLLSVYDSAFAMYGKVLEGYDFTSVIAALNAGIQVPETGVGYEPSLDFAESTESFLWLQHNVYGGMPIQIGCCFGNSRTLNCLEYHRGAEVNIAVRDAVLLLAPLQRVKSNHIHTDEVEAFEIKAGQAVLLYETSLHYAPCNAPGNSSFCMGIVLPRNTNTEKPAFTPLTPEDQLLWANNKWLIAHPDSPEAAQGAFVGLEGENLVVPE